MAVSCPEVMYGAYYPYLYGRGAARPFHHAPHFQYERLNVQSGACSNGGSEAYGGGGAAVSSGSASSGAHSPASPHHHHHHHPARLRTKEEDHSRASADGGGSSESDGECGGGGTGGGGGAACSGRARAQYVSANCVVFTHYSGDVAAVVDDHFTRALAPDKHKECVPMVSRNLPASFFNALAVGGAGGGAACGGGVELYEYDPWQAYGGYGGAAHRHAAEYHAAAAASHHSMAAAGYGGLLLGRSHLHQYKPVEWPPPHPAHAHAQHVPPHAHAHAHLDPAACASYSYPAVAGLEAPVQDTSKDLYWF